MSQPATYARQFDFTGFASDHPTTPLPGVSVDAELNAAKVTLDGVLRSLAAIQRDDGKLLNASVSLETLNPSVLATLGAGSNWSPRGTWVTSTDYVMTDVIQAATATYLCAVSHTSAALLATDVAAGYWILIFDTAGTTPADGSVTTAKLADGAVTAPKIGFTALDLSGAIRAGGGLTAGTAPLGGLLHAKAATGDVIAKIERTTDAQGIAAFEIRGVDNYWRIRMAQNEDHLEIFTGGIGDWIARFESDNHFVSRGNIIATGAAPVSSGEGISMAFTGGQGIFDSYNWTAAAWRDLKLRGADVYVTAGGIDILKVSSTGADFIAGTLKKAGVDVGYLDLPLNAQNGAYTLALTDRSKCVYSQNVAGQSIAIPANASVAFPVGSIVSILNDGSNPITITTTGITLVQEGTGSTGNRTLATKGRAVLHKVGTDRWFISGSGLS